MRWGAVVLVFLSGCSSCTKKEVATIDRVAEAGSPLPPPAPVLFDDSGDAGQLTLGPGISIDIRPAGPSLIIVKLSASPKGAWKEIFIERHVVGREGPPQKAGFDNTSWSRHEDIESAEPNTTYAYRAKLDEGGAWTTDVMIRTANPKRPPPAPTNVVARAETPWAVEVSWDLDARAAAGIEVDVQDGDAKEWSMLAIVDPHRTKFTHGFRLPKKTSKYRVAAFNTKGMSAFAESTPIMTPEKDPKPPKVPPLSPCTKGPPPAAPMDSLMDTLVSEDPELHSYAGGGGAVAPRVLIGKYKGCLRDLGAFELQGDTMHARKDADPTEGFPVLTGILGAGWHEGSQLGTFAFVNGHYAEVDRAQFCGDPYTESDLSGDSTFHPKQDGDVITRHGPFDGCLLEKLDWP